jgi:hypothetical protein
LGVVENQEVARLHLLGQILKHPIDWHGAAAVKQLRAAALSGWVLCDQFWGKVKVKVTQTEAAFGLDDVKGGAKSGHVLEGRTRPVPSGKTRLSHDLAQSI